MKVPSPRERELQHKTELAQLLEQLARAKRIEVTLAAAPERVTLTIADDGAGFDPEHVVPARPSWGLTIMQERAEAIGARLTVESAPGKGTRVCVAIDCPG